MCCAGLLVLATSSSLSQEQTSDQVLNSGCLANLTLEKYKRVADGFQTARDGLSMEDFHNLLMALQKNPLPTAVMPVVTEHPCKETTTPSGNEEKSFNCSGVRFICHGFLRLGLLVFLFFLFFVFVFFKILILPLKHISGRREQQNITKFKHYIFLTMGGLY